MYMINILENSDNIMPPNISIAEYSSVRGTSILLSQRLYSVDYGLLWSNEEVEGSFVFNFVAPCIRMNIYTLKSYILKGGLIRCTTVSCDVLKTDLLVPH